LELNTAFANPPNHVSFISPPSSLVAFFLKTTFLAQFDAVWEEQPPNLTTMTPETMGIGGITPRHETETARESLRENSCPLKKWMITSQQIS